MAIIKTLRLQNFIQRGLPRMVLCTLAFFLGFIQLTQAAITTAKIIADSGQVGNTAIYIYASGQVTLTCSATGGTAGKYRFFKGEKPLTEMLASPTYDAISSFDAEANSGAYFCIAQDDTNTDVEVNSTAIILSITCTTVAQCTHASAPECKTATGGTLYCGCTYGGDYASCDACAKADHGGCDQAKHQICKDDGSGCDCEYGGDNVDHCHVCKKATTVSTNPDPGCEAQTPQCSDDGSKCEKRTTQASPATGSSGGTTGKHSDTTSSAGTVTSTACLVIASVVVALMN